MGNMMETRGYQVKMNADNVLQYNPSNILPRPAPGYYSDEPLKAVHFTKEIKPNPNSSTMLILDDENNPLNRGDELGVFTKNGILVGAFVYEDAMMGGLVFGDDETEDGIDGILADETYVFKIWDKDLNEERVVEMNFIQGSNTYLKDDLCAVSFKTETILGLNEIAGLSIQLSPNPATEEVNFSIELDQPTNLTIEIYQVDGQLIDIVGTQKFEQGQSLVNYKVDHLSNGLYIYRVTNNEKSYTERFTIAR